MRARSILLAALSLGVAFASTLTLAAPASSSGIPAGDQLTATVTALDSALFNAYNHCDLASFARYIAPDVEFYHDKGGLTRTRAKLVESIKNNICGKVRRELVAGTLEVYPIKDFGAVEIGTHRFCELGTGHCAGAARFIHLWQYNGGNWQITRVISYDHHAVTP